MAGTPPEFQTIYLERRRMAIGSGIRGYIRNSLAPEVWARGDKRVPRAVALLYGVVGTLWILIEHELPGGPSTLKDFLFLIPTIYILYLVVDYGMAGIRKRETELRTGESRLRSVLECDPSGTLLVDREGRFTYANPAALKILGLEKEEIIGSAYEDLRLEVVTFEGHPLPRENRPVYRALQEGEFSTEAELGFTRPDGARIILSVNAGPLLGPKGEVAGVVTSFIDITERTRERESTLRESRERYQDLVETVKDLVWETDRNLVIRYLSPRFRDILGYDLEEWLGRTPFGLMQKNEAERVVSLLGPVIENAREFENLDATVIHRDGSPVPFEVSGTPYFDSAGTLLGWRGVARDISRRKKAEKRIREKEEHFRQMFVQNEEPIILFQPNTAEVLDVNPAAVSLYGYTREELLEKGLAPRVDPEGYEELERRIRGVDASNKLALDGLIHVRKDGERINVSLRGTSIRTISGGRFTYCTFRDVTPRVRMEEEAKSKQAQLIHSNRMASLGKVVTGIAHELNNPNNLIMFNAPMIEQAWQDAERILAEYRREHGDFPLGGLPYSEMREIVPKLLQGITDASWRIRNFVGDLKGFALTGTRDRECEVRVHEIIRSSVGILSHEIRKRCSRFQVDEAPGSLVVRGCRQELEQVLINLILNSLEALPDRDRAIQVSASTNESEGVVEIVVRDEGVGMSPEALKNISQPFFTTKQDSGGLGLGLSIAYSIVEGHHGKIRFESEVGKGTVARILLRGVDSRNETCGKSLSPEYR